MTTRGIILYEDKMLPSAGGDYPLHDLVMRMVEDEIAGETWQLRKAIDKNPRKGIDNLIKDLANTSLIAQSGHLYLLVDKDRVAEHLGMRPDATEDAIVAALRSRSDAPQQVCVHFLYPNLEGLLRAVDACAPALLPRQLIDDALRKKLNARDMVLNTVKKLEHREVRMCVRGHQSGLDGLVRSLATLLG